MIEPPVFGDDRGYFFESFNAEKFRNQTGLKTVFVQDNESMSTRGVLRGLHFQTGNYAQTKLVRVIKGEVQDVVVDLRKESPTYGQHFSIILNETNKHQLYVPKGFAHGFLTLSEKAVFAYKCDTYYNKESEGGIIYNDKTLGIDWELPEDQIALSPKDMILPPLSIVIKNANFNHRS